MAAGKVTVKEAQELIRRVAVKKQETDEAVLWEAGGRVLAEDLRARFSHPPFPRSPLDGYAVQAQDLKDAGPDGPACLQVTEKVCAGQCSKRRLKPGEAVRIMTGAPIPAGADTVVRQEDTDYGEREVRIYKRQDAYDNYCPEGEDFREGDVLIRQGARMDAVRIGIAASAGYSRIRVRKKVRTAVLSTGTELCAPGMPLGEGQIYDSSLYLIAERVRELGGELVMAERVPDEEQALRAYLRRAKTCADLVVTTGGVSVGEKDLVRKALEQEGARFLFDRVLVKPGSPTTASILGTTLVFSLSGNPFAAAVHLELLVRTATASFLGCEEMAPSEKEGILISEFQRPCRTDRWIRGREESGRIWIPETKEKSGILSSMEGCSCLVKIEKDRERIAKGEKVWYIRI